MILNINNQGRKRQNPPKAPSSSTDTPKQNVSDSTSTPKKKKPKRIFLKIILTLCYLVLFVLIVAIAAGIYVINTCGKDLPDVEAMEKFEPSETSIIYSSDGTVIGTLFKENRYWVPIDEIPTNMKNAIVAIEDSRFYTHPGIDFKAIARSVVADFKGRSAAQGASTITMQLARDIFLHPKKNLKRKIQEIIISLQIERRFTKKEILERYLNQIYFGSGAYGIEAAAQTYFGRHAKDLTLAQSAMIAGLPPAPSVYSPFVDEESALIRQGMVLDRMVSCGYITEKEKKEALAEKMKYAPKKTEIQMMKYPYFTSYVLKQLSQKYSDDLLYRGGLKIYTTLDIKMQRIGEQAVKDGMKLATSQYMNASQGALVAIDPRNGYIKALVGGKGYTEKDQFNRAWQAKRQPGSSFKPVIYAAAIDTGYSPNFTIIDKPVSYRMGDGTVWSPQNSDRSFKGAMSIRDNLKWSRNVPVVKLLDLLGIDTVLDYASRLGITEPLEPHLSLALGSGVITPLELASVYSVFASGGVRYEPVAIKLIKDSSGQIIEDHRWPVPEQVIAESTAYTMSEMMRGVIDSGTGTSAYIGRPAAGKTGTTDEFRDAWFAGFVPQLVCAVWTGNDDNSRMNHVYGGDLPAPIWADFMKKALASEKKMEFGEGKDGKVVISICADTNLRANGTCPNIVKQSYSPGAVPQSFCYKHGPIKYNSRTGRVERVKAEEVQPEVKKEEQRRPEGEPRPVEEDDNTEKEDNTPVATPPPRPKAIAIPKPPSDVQKVETVPIPKIEDNYEGENKGNVIEVPDRNIDDEEPSNEL